MPVPVILACESEPKGTPAAVIARLDREIGAVLAESTIEARLADLGTVPMPLNAQEFGTARTEPRFRRGCVRSHSMGGLVARF